MKIDDVKNVCVVGAGNMGHQISLLCAIRGFKTTCTDTSEEVLKKAESFADSYLAGRVKKEKMTEEEARRAREKVSYIPDLPTAAKDADYVIEAVVEILDVKRKLFAELDRLTPQHAILSTNSSRIVSSRIADATGRPSKVINLHFFNPALVMKLVEVVQGPHTSDETVQISMDLCSRLDKIGALQKKEIEGFCSGRIIRAITEAALWTNAMGVASVEDIDKVCVHALGHPMGPFRLMDLVGIDLEHTICMEKFQATGDTADLPYPSVVEKYTKGHYGEKTGKGWYEYPKK
jgi:3-hydroxybutyryl-CoA dehydrogenase